MGKNVIILGAGFSYDADIPLLPGFMQVMFDLAMTKHYQGKPLSAQDCDVFAKAITVRHELNGYHARASFDDRNIEDVLSILSFRVLSGSGEAREQLKAFTRAITRTIEITCNVHHPGLPKEGDQWSINKEGPDIYRSFWKSLLKWHSDGNPFPTIISFNYDLVLERALLQVLISKEYPVHGPKHIRLKYHHPFTPNEIWNIHPCEYNREDLRRDQGHCAKKSKSAGATGLLEIDYLKLHGSLNFPSAQLDNPEDYNIAMAQENPYILPPIFNKLTSNTPNEMWKVALESISSAQNIIIAGYSLPQTDIYMQYFLKAAVGPNLNLNKIYVFNPALFRDGAEAMKQRYSNCFSAQLQRQIEFRPQGNGDGSTNHLINLLYGQPKYILY